MSALVTQLSEGHGLATEVGSGAKGKKWDRWEDQVLVRQVLATDPLTCERGRTAERWGEVSDILGQLEPKVILRSGESCRQRIKKLVEVYKVCITR